MTKESSLCGEVSQSITASTTRRLRILFVSGPEEEVGGFRGFNFTVSAASARSSSPRNNEIVERQELRDNQEEEDDVNPEESDEESDVSVDSHGDEDPSGGYSSRLNDSSDIDQDLSVSSPTR